MSKILYIVGIGPGDRNFILPAAERIIEQSDVLIGGKRNLDLFGSIGKEKVTIVNNLEDICQYIKENIGSKAIAVIATGDPGVFSIMEFLKNRLEGIELQVIPGISAFQYFCSKLNLSWHDMRITSLHGRDENSIYEIIEKNKKVAVFTGGKFSPNSICQELIKRNISNITISVGERLSYADERIVTGTPDKISQMSFDGLAIMVIQNEKPGTDSNKVWDFSTPGIPDHMFIRGDVPMTKEEVRAVTLSKLRLRDGDIVYDIGAGTGSVSVECGLICNRGVVYAIEKEKDALELIEKNIDRFAVGNVRVISGEAPWVLSGLPEPDRVFIGGTCGNMKDILREIGKFKKAGRVVVNAVAIESAYEAIKGFEEEGFQNMDVSSISVSRSRAAGSKHLMQALNPVYIISAEFGGQ